MNDEWNATWKRLSREICDRYEVAMRSVQSTSHVPAVVAVRYRLVVAAIDECGLPRKFVRGKLRWDDQRLRSVLSAARRKDSQPRPLRSAEDGEYPLSEMRRKGLEDRRYWIGGSSLRWAVSSRSAGGLE